MEKPKVDIRSASLADTNLLAEMGAKTFADSFGADNTPEDMAAYLAASFSPDQVAKELADSASVFLIAEIDGAPVGYVKLKASERLPGISGERPIELVRIYSIKEWIGHGIGAALMRASLEEAARLGCDTIWLGVWEKNLHAREFYRRWGFVDVGTHTFQLGSDLQTDYHMQRAVEESIEGG